jgi:hypothetical protein
MVTFENYLCSKPTNRQDSVIIGQRMRRLSLLKPTFFRHRRELAMIFQGFALLIALSAHRMGGVAGDPIGLNMAPSLKRDSVADRLWRWSKPAVTPPYNRTACSTDQVHEIFSSLSTLEKLRQKS